MIKQKTNCLMSSFLTYSVNTGMRIVELFQADKVSWKWDYSSDTEVEATFVVGDIQYKFYAYTDDPNSTEWEVEFKIYEGGPEDNRYGVTGTGNSAHVMSAVVSILREFLKKYRKRVTQLTFTAKERSRRDLYTRMVRRLLPTWELSRVGQNFRVTAP